MMYSPTASGAEMEALVVGRIYLEGGRVSIPFDHGMGYDMVSDFDGVLKRIEVKRSSLTTSRPAKPYIGTTRFDCDLRARNMLSVTRLPSVETSDCFVIGAGEYFYVIPTAFLEGRQSISLRPPGYEPKSPSRAHSKLDTESFLNAWDWLRKP